MLVNLFACLQFFFLKSFWPEISRSIECLRSRSVNSNDRGLGFIAYEDAITRIGQAHQYDSNHGQIATRNFLWKVIATWHFFLEAFHMNSSLESKHPGSWSELF